MKPGVLFAAMEALAKLEARSGTRTRALHEPYTPEFVAAHLAAGRPLLTLGIAFADPVAIEARSLAARSRIRHRVARAKGDPLGLIA